MIDKLASYCFRRDCGGLLKLGDEAVRTMLGFVQLSDEATEAGGVLIGRHILGCRDVVVDRVTIPMPGDRRRRTRFDRARRRHQEVLDEEWMRSRGTRVYLGEWHTHAEPRPRPSQIDMDDWHRRLARDHVEAEFLFFAIVGQVEIRVWEGSRLTFGVSELRRRKESHIVTTD